VQPTVRSGREVLTATPLRIGYSGTGSEKALVSTPELRVERGDRVAIIGQNGSGKSTLLKTIVGELRPLKGRVSFGTNVKVGYYAQGHEGLPIDGSPLSILLSTQPMGEEAARTYLARFLFRGDEVHRPVSALSGGERSRLALACLLVEGANLLILDEPTNHLDIQSRETLEEMLTAYDGTVIFVSHDRFFIDRVATRVWDIANEELAQYLGNFTDAARQRSKLSATEPPVQRSAPAPVAEVPLERPPVRRSGQASESRLQKQLASAERDISRLEARLNDLSDAIAIAGVDGQRERLEVLGVEYAEAERQLDGAYQLWEELNGELESLAVAAAAG
jgi:ATP-binding cassette subfamily F protein 3